jgi:hypothetical protein
MNEIAFETLVDWVEGRLTPEEAAQVEARVAAAGPAVQADVAWLRQFAQLSREITLASPPDWVRRRLRRRFPAHYPAPPPTTGWLQRWRAALTFDSQTHPVAAGVRGGAADAGRQLVYTAAGGDVALNLQPHADKERVDLLGQVFPFADEMPLFSVQLLRDGVEIGLTMADDLGEFVFTDLPPATVALVCSSDQAELIIPPFRLSRD